MPFDPNDMTLGDQFRTALTDLKAAEQRAQQERDRLHEKQLWSAVHRWYSDAASNLGERIGRAVDNMARGHAPDLPFTYYINDETHFAKGIIHIDIPKQEGFQELVDECERLNVSLTMKYGVKNQNGAHFITAVIDPRDRFALPIAIVPATGPGISQVEKPPVARTTGGRPGI